MRVRACTARLAHYSVSCVKPFAATRYWHYLAYFLIISRGGISVFLLHLPTLFIPSLILYIPRRSASTRSAIRGQCQQMQLSLTSSPLSTTASPSGGTAQQMHLVHLRGTTFVHENVRVSCKWSNDWSDVRFEKYSDAQLLVRNVCKFASFMVYQCDASFRCGIQP